MLFVDAHCDILSKIKIPQELFSNNHHWDAKRALSNGPFIQVLSLFAHEKNLTDTKTEMKKQLELANLAEKKYPDRLLIIKNFSQASSFSETSKSSKKQQNNISGGNANPNQIGCIIEAEGSEIIGETLEELDSLYDEGLRILTLCWNYDNRVCDSVAGHSKHNGLSAFGKKVIRKAQSMGIIIDVSHASDKTFSELAQISQNPFIASHSNSRAICSHKRNLTDEQIKTIAERGGFIGVNLFPDFLNTLGNARLVDIIKHIEHMAALVGSSYIGFGCDFDGIDRTPLGINGVEDMSKIIEELLKLNYLEDTVIGIAGLNFMRLLKSTM